MTAPATHAEALHALLCGSSAGADESTLTESLAACHAFIASCTVCKTGRRPNDLVLQMFIEANDESWHVSSDGSRSARRALFSAYMAAGHIRIDQPVCWSTARAALRLGSSSPPPNTWPLEVAMRRSSVATTVALLEAGADESQVRNPDDPHSPNLVRSAWLLPDNPDVAPMMAAAVTEVLMRRRLTTPFAPEQAAPRRRVFV